MKKKSFASKKSVVNGIVAVELLLAVLYGIISAVALPDFSGARDSLVNVVEKIRTR